MSRLVPNQLTNGFSSRSSRFPSSPSPTSTSQQFPCSSSCWYSSVRLDRQQGHQSLPPIPLFKLASLQLTRKYTVAQIYPSTSPSPNLERDPNAPGLVEIDNKPTPIRFSDLANDRVENWTSGAYADIPFRPDFTLFEPIETIDDSVQGELRDDLCNQLKSRVDASLSDRLANLIRGDPSAAEQLKSELVNNGIHLAANPLITSHCFDLLFKHQNIGSYIDWLPLVAPAHFQRTTNLPSQQPPISTAEAHLNQIIKLAPNGFSFVSRFMEILVSKHCVSRHLNFAVIRHLVRTQEPGEAIALTRQILGFANERSYSPELIRSSQDFLVLQLANQGYLFDALELCYKNLEHRRSESGSNVPRAYPLMYQVLADQLVSRIEKDTSQSSHRWSTQLKRVISHWRVDHQDSLSLWLTPRTLKHLETNNVPSLTKQISKKYVKLFRNAVAVNPDVCHQFSHEKLSRFTAYFRSLFDEHYHPKFVKAAQLANLIHQILPLRNSFQILQENLKLLEVFPSPKTEEQFFKHLILGSPPWLETTSGQPIGGKVGIPHHVQFEERSDILFLWAHSWMIFYHRSGSPHRAIEIFLDYFIPIGCDVDLMNRIRYGRHGCDAPSQRYLKSTSPTSRGGKYHKLVHPTTGVLTVLYDSVLSICPPKLMPALFDSFLSQHFHRPSESSTISNLSASSRKRLEPNFGSFRPFVRAFLKAKDVDGALNVLKSMHLNLHLLVNGMTFQDEGGWIDLLEWCAMHSSGPKPKEFDPHYHWGAQRKRKIKGWDGKMKEELVYLVLKKFFSFKFALTYHARSCSSSIDPNFFEPSRGFHESRGIAGDSDWDEESPSKVESIQDLRIFRTENPSIEDRLDFLVIDRNSPNIHQPVFSHISSNFPSLKLLSKIKFGFYLAKNSKGLKTMNDLITIYK